MPDDINVPEPETKAKPILRPSTPIHMDTTPVPVPPFRNGKRATLAEKIVMPARTSLIWDGCRHFMFGALSGASAAAVGIAGVLKTIGFGPIEIAAAIAGAPYIYLVAGTAVILGGIAAARKVAKEKSGGKDWTDTVYLILEFLVQLITKWKTKEVQK